MSIGAARTPGPLSRAVARLLREEIEDQGLSQTAVAAMIGRSQSLVSTLMDGSTGATLEELHALCRALGLGVIEVMADAIATL